MAKAILKKYYAPHPVCHRDVIEIKSDRPMYRRYKCLVCGEEWFDTTNTPIILPEDVERDIDKYYPDYIFCDNTPKI